MSLLSEYTNTRDNPLLKIVLDLKRRVELLENERNTGKRGPKLKPKKGGVENFMRPIKDFILIQNEVPYRILLINDSETQTMAPVIEMSKDEFKLFLESILVSKVGEKISFSEFKNTNKFASRDGEGWDIENI